MVGNVDSWQILSIFGGFENSILGSDNICAVLSIDFDVHLKLPRECLDLEIVAKNSRLLHLNQPALECPVDFGLCMCLELRSRSRCSPPSRCPSGRLYGDKRFEIFGM
jgi:hypothetical protein